MDGRLQGLMMDFPLTLAPLLERAGEDFRAGGDRLAAARTGRWRGRPMRTFAGAPGAWLPR